MFGFECLVCLLFIHEEHATLDRLATAQPNASNELPLLAEIKFIVQINCIVNVFVDSRPTAEITQSINARLIGRRYTTRPEAPTVVSYKHDQKVHSWVFSECTRISYVVKVGWSVPGSWTGVKEATFSKCSSCFCKNVSRWASRPLLYVCCMWHRSAHTAWVLANK